MISSTSTSDFTCTEGPYGLPYDKSMVSCWAPRSPNYFRCRKATAKLYLLDAKVKNKNIYIQNLWIKVETSPSLPNTAVDRSTEAQNFRKIFQNSKDKTEIL